MECITKDTKKKKHARVEREDIICTECTVIKINCICVKQLTVLKSSAKHPHYQKMLNVHFTAEFKHSETRNPQALKHMVHIKNSESTCKD